SSDLLVGKKAQVDRTPGRLHCGGQRGHLESSARRQSGSLTSPGGNASGERREPLYFGHARRPRIGGRFFFVHEMWPHCGRSACPCPSRTCATSRSSPTSTTARRPW